MMQQCTGLNEEKQIVSYICQDILVNKVYSLSQQFLIMINQRAIKGLDNWVSQSKAA